MHRAKAAGGNTSIKRDGVMWIKAQRRQLADALDDDIMVPVVLEELRAAAAFRNDPAAASELRRERVGVARVALDDIWAG